MSEVNLRPACPDDAGAIARIYNHYILESTATFHTEPVDAAERAEWMVERGEAYPTLVAEVDGTVCAWGALSAYRPRPAWHPTVEVAIYVAPEHTGRGIGPLLIDELLDRALENGYHSVVSQIVAGNEPSAAIAERSGFVEVGRLREAGLKLGQRLDVILMQRMLGPQGIEALAAPAGSAKIRNRRVDEGIGDA